MRAKHGVTALVVAGMLTFGAPAFATPTLVGTNIDPTAIDGLVVDGVIYDVALSFTPAASPFTPGTDKSADAAEALAAAFNSLSVLGLGNVRSTPANALFAMVDGTLTGDGATADTGNGWHSVFGTIPLWGEIIAINPEESDAYQAANFTAVGFVLPEPATWAFFAFGLAGLGFVSRRVAR